MEQKEKIIAAIKVISSRLNGLNVKWLIGGSGSLLVHGLDVTPNDIDIVVAPKNYDEVKSTMKDLLVGRTEIDGDTMDTPFMVGDINGDLFAHKIDRGLLTTINVGGVNVSVYQLRVEYDFYKRRADKVEENKTKIELIEKALFGKAHS